ncbi:coenzyme F420-0:L-glutamate ligase [Candidatus Daviesbacteria bacterium]|nr:coenzyme F420-0:L-glutamate ligase [Candidatus Daviesbacteria bacterium]
MIVNAIKTHKITSDDKDILVVLDKYIEKLEENSIVAITSKIVSVCEGSTIKIEDTVDKEKLIRENSQFFLPRSSNKYNINFTITNNILAASAGIDESNGNGYYILWPKNPQDSANKIREFLVNKFKLRSVGVIITDSKTTPLRWGVTGIALAHSGFNAVYDYIGKPDLFGRFFEFEKLNIADSLACSAVMEMGEGNEQTPLATIQDLKNIEFQARNPTGKELESIKISMEDDLYSPILKNIPWQKGDKSL